MSISFLRTQRGHILFLLLLWIVQILLINPHGEFPSNDDWAFALSVREAVEHGRFFVSGWAGMNLIAQIGWGSLFCLPFGFSFTALRISTIVAGGLGLWGTYKLIRESTNHQPTALAGSLIMAVNPLYLGLSATFMTDVPFYAAVIWSYYFLVVGLKKDAIKPIVIGLGLGIVSLLIRQFGIVVFLSFSLAYVVLKGINWRSIAIASACSIGAVIFQAVYQKWLIWMMNKATIYNAQTTNILKLKFL
ncbi:MAG TPA: glycosyltransferase family 39 protein, partial [Spirosoma sp.]|nr:glycosyltransferase family 39 protein [Spirosoma sp.]